MRNNGQATRHGTKWLLPTSGAMAGKAGTDGGLPGTGGRVHQLSQGYTVAHTPAALVTFALPTPDTVPEAARLATGEMGSV